MPIKKLLDSTRGQKQLDFIKGDHRVIPNGISIREGINGMYMNKVPKIRNKYYSIMYDSKKGIGFIFTLDTEYGCRYRYNNLLTVDEVLKIMSDLEKIRNDFRNDRNNECGYGPYQTFKHRFIDDELYVIFDNRYLRNHQIHISNVHYLLEILHELYLLYGK